MSEKKLPTLKEARTQRGVSQSLLAKHSGVHQSRISLIEKEEIAPTFPEEIKLSFALNMLHDEIEWPVMPKGLTMVPGVADEDQARKEEKEDGI
jgi:transcriptional regulator with XRE-family HTH domain